MHTRLYFNMLHCSCFALNLESATNVETIPVVPGGTDSPSVSLAPMGEGHMQTA